LLKLQTNHNSNAATILTEFGRCMFMRYPKEKRVYCPKCRTYTVHSVSLYKKGKDRKMAAGARRYHRKKKGYGSQPKHLYLYAVEMG